MHDLAWYKLRDAKEALEAAIAQGIQDDGEAEELHRTARYLEQLLDKYNK